MLQCGYVMCLYRLSYYQSELVLSLTHFDGDLKTVLHEVRHPQREVRSTAAGLWQRTGRQRQPVALILTHFGTVMAVTSPKTPRQCDQTMTGLTSV